MLPRHIVVPIDFSPGSEQALAYACELAWELGATVHLVNALGPAGEVPLGEQLIDELTSEHVRGLQELMLRYGRRGQIGFGPALVEVGDPRDAILSAVARVGGDLIVMSTHGRRGLSRLVLGSVAEDVLRRAPCPVLAVRERVEEARADRGGEREATAREVQQQMSMALGLGGVR